VALNTINQTKLPMNSLKGAGMDRKVQGEGQASEEDWKV